MPQDTDLTRYDATDCRIRTLHPSTTVYRNWPFLNLNQLVFAGIEIGTDCMQNIRNAAKIRKLLCWSTSLARLGKSVANFGKGRG